MQGGGSGIGSGGGGGGGGGGGVSKEVRSGRADSAMIQLWQRSGGGEEMLYIVWWQGGRATYCPRSSFNYWRCLVRLVAAVNRVVGRSGRHNSPGRLKNYLSSTGTMLQLLLTAGCIVCPG